MSSRRRGRLGRAEPEAALGNGRADGPDTHNEDTAATAHAGRRSPHGSAWSRLAFAAAISVFVVGTFASMGGLTYAASGARSTYDTVKQIAVKRTLKVSVHKSSAADEYPSTKQQTPAFTPPKPKVSSSKPATSSVAGTQGGTLPFTGFSLLGTVAVSLFLVGVGVLLRRRERKG
jgi:hypothetical protein